MRNFEILKSQFAAQSLFELLTMRIFTIVCLIDVLSTGKISFVTQVCHPIKSFFKRLRSRLFLYETMNNEQYLIIKPSTQTYPLRIRTMSR
jgi:hypothetical protein